MSAVTEATIVKAGSIVLLSHGAYSRYTIAGFVRALVDLDMRQEFETWLVEHPEHQYEALRTMTPSSRLVAGRLKINGEAFAEYLLTCGKFEEVPFQEFHMGDYGELPAWYPDNA